MVKIAVSKSWALLARRLISPLRQFNLNQEVISKLAESHLGILALKKMGPLEVENILQNKDQGQELCHALSAFPLLDVKITTEGTGNGRRSSPLTRAYVRQIQQFHARYALRLGEPRHYNQL